MTPGLPSTSISHEIKIHSAQSELTNSHNSVKQASEEATAAVNSIQSIVTGLQSNQGVLADLNNDIADIKNSLTTLDAGLSNVTDSVNQLDEVVAEVVDVSTSVGTSVVNIFTKYSNSDDEVFAGTDIFYNAESPARGEVTRNNLSTEVYQKIYTQLQADYFDVRVKTSNINNYVVYHERIFSAMVKEFDINVNVNLTTTPILDQQNTSVLIKEELSRTTPKYKWTQPGLNPDGTHEPFIIAGPQVSETVLPMEVKIQEGEYNNIAYPSGGKATASTTAKALSQLDHSDVLLSGITVNDTNVIKITFTFAEDINGKFNAAGLSVGDNFIFVSDVSSLQFPMVREFNFASASAAGSFQNIQSEFELMKGFNNTQGEIAFDISTLNENLDVLDFFQNYLTVVDITSNSISFNSQPKTTLLNEDISINIESALTKYGEANSTSGTPLLFALKVYVADTEPSDTHPYMGTANSNIIVAASEYNAVNNKLTTLFLIESEDDIIDKPYNLAYQPTNYSGNYQGYNLLNNSRFTNVPMWSSDYSVGEVIPELNNFGKPNHHFIVDNFIDTPTNNLIVKTEFTNYYKKTDRVEIWEIREDDTGMPLIFKRYKNYTINRVTPDGKEVELTRSGSAAEQVTGLGQLYLVGGKLYSYIQGDTSWSGAELRNKLGTIGDQLLMGYPFNNDESYWVNPEHNGSIEYVANIVNTLKFTETGVLLNGEPVVNDTDDGDATGTLTNTTNYLLDFTDSSLANQTISFTGVATVPQPFISPVLVPPVINTIGTSAGLGALFGTSKSKPLKVTIGDNSYIFNFILEIPEDVSAHIQAQLNNRTPITLYFENSPSIKISYPTGNFFKSIIDLQVQDPVRQETAVSNYEVSADFYSNDGYLSVTSTNPAYEYAKGLYDQGYCVICQVIYGNPNPAIFTDPTADINGTDGSVTLGPDNTIKYTPGTGNKGAVFAITTKLEYGPQLNSNYTITSPGSVEGYIANKAYYNINIHMDRSAKTSNKSETGFILVTAFTSFNKLHQFWAQNFGYNESIFTNNMWMNPNASYSPTGFYGWHPIAKYIMVSAADVQYIQDTSYLTPSGIGDAEVAEFIYLSPNELHPYTADQENALNNTNIVIKKLALNTQTQIYSQRLNQEDIKINNDTTTLITYTYDTTQTFPLLTYTFKPKDIVDYCLPAITNNALNGTLTVVVASPSSNGLAMIPGIYLSYNGASLLNSDGERIPSNTNLVLDNSKTLEYTLEGVKAKIDGDDIIITLSDETRNIYSVQLYITPDFIYNPLDLNITPSPINDDSGSANATNRTKSVPYFENYNPNPLQTSGSHKVKTYEVSTLKTNMEDGFFVAKNLDSSQWKLDDSASIVVNYKKVNGLAYIYTDSSSITDITSVVTLFLPDAYHSIGDLLKLDSDYSNIPTANVFSRPMSSKMIAALVTAQTGLRAVVVYSENASYTTDVYSGNNYGFNRPINGDDKWVENSLKTFYQDTLKIKVDEVNHYLFVHDVLSLNFNAYYDSVYDKVYKSDNIKAILFTSFSSLPEQNAELVFDNVDNYKNTYNDFAKQIFYITYGNMNKAANTECNTFMNNFSSLGQGIFNQVYSLFENAYLGGSVSNYSPDIIAALRYTGNTNPYIGSSWFALAQACGLFSVYSNFSDHWTSSAGPQLFNDGTLKSKDVWGDALTDTKSAWTYNSSLPLDKVVIAVEYNYLQDFESEDVKVLEYGPDQGNYSNSNPDPTNRLTRIIYDMAVGSTLSDTVANLKVSPTPASFHVPTIDELNTLLHDL
jgi:hypothetical protein